MGCCMRCRTSRRGRTSSSTGLPSQPLLAPLHPPQAYDVHWLAATVAGAAGVEALGEGYAAVEQAEELETASPEFEPEVRGVYLCRHHCRQLHRPLPSFLHAPGHFGEPYAARPAVFCTTRWDELWIAQCLHACCRHHLLHSGRKRLLTPPASVLPPCAAGRHHGRLGRGQLPRPHAGAAAGPGGATRMPMSCGCLQAHDWPPLGGMGVAVHSART